MALAGRVRAGVRRDVRDERGRGATAAADRVPVIVLVVRRVLRLRWREPVRPLLACAVLDGRGVAVLDRARRCSPCPGPGGAGQLRDAAGDQRSVLVRGGAARARLLAHVRVGRAGRGCPEFAPYLDEPVVVALSFALLRRPGLGGVPRGRTVAAPGRRAGAVAAVRHGRAVPVRTPVAVRPGAGLAVRRTLPALGAFRTTNKAGAVLVLGAALVVAAAVAAWWTSSDPSRRAAAAVAAVAVLVGWDLSRVRRWSVPPHVRRPAVLARRGGRRGRRAERPAGVARAGRGAAAVPLVRAAPDDLALPLFARPTVLRTTLPIASPYAANLLAAVDTAAAGGLAAARGAEHRGPLPRGRRRSWSATTRCGSRPGGPALDGPAAGGRATPG